MFGPSPRTALTIAASSGANPGEFAFILAGLGMALNLLPQSGTELWCWQALFCRYVIPYIYPAGEVSGETETLERQTLEEAIERRSKFRWIS